MKEILTALKAMGKVVLEQRSHALRESNYAEVARYDEILCQADIATNRCEVLSKILKGQPHE